ncbi:hypothetical protein [Mesorhizobium loti]|nr:hypothetical protein [Mesorhizobium loti]
MMSRKRMPASAAIVAALILLVQAFSAGAAMGTQVVAGPRDAFGNVICTARTGGSSQDPSHGGGFDCDFCLFGCDIGSAVIPAASDIEPVSLAFVIVSDGKKLVDAPIWRPELATHCPRGPPA